MAFLFDDLVVWIVKDMAEEELYGNKEKINEQLLSLQTKLDMGEITEEQYQREEEELLKKLGELQEREKGSEE